MNNHGRLAECARESRVACVPVFLPTAVFSDL